MNPSLLNILDAFKAKVSEAASNVAASVASNVNGVRDAAADAIAEAGTGSSVALAAKVGSQGNIYTKIQAIGADWRTWALLGVSILVVFYFIVRRKK